MSASPEPLAEPDPIEALDLLVLGAGIAGLTAAARAAQEGASVLLVDAAPAVGGSAAYAGFIWTAPTEAVMDENNPSADRQLSHKLVADHDLAVDWVRSLGVVVKEPVTVVRFGKGRETEMATLLATCERLVRDAPGCAVSLSTRAEHLLVESGLSWVRY